VSTQPTLPPDQTALQAKITTRLTLRRAFKDALAKCLPHIEEALKAANGLSEIDRQHAITVGRLCAYDFYSLPITPDANDFGRQDDDLRYVARAVDPLIEAIGADAKLNSHVISDGDLNDHFKDQLERALLGNATYLLEQCADAAQEAIDSPDTAADHAYDLAHAE
jgi:hypothetical protein